MKLLQLQKPKWYRPSRGDKCNTVSKTFTFKLDCLFVEVFHSEERLDAEDADSLARFCAIRAHS